jgi:hypothetical protein
MKRTKNNSLHIFSITLIIIGTTLILFNVIGYFHYTTVSINDPHLEDDFPTTIPEEVFWDNAYRRDNEPLEQYLQRLAELVSKRMLLIDGKYTKPTIFENWILWIYSNYKGYYEWSNTKKAVRLGGGYCSQHAIVFNNILREQKIQSRIIKLGGHVVNEVLINGEWKVYDSDYNVVFNASLKDLENDSIHVYRSYVDAGRPEDEAKHWQKVFASDADNWHYKKTRTYAEEKYYIEGASLYLAWVIPVILILLVGSRSPSQGDAPLSQIPKADISIRFS